MRFATKFDRLIVVVLIVGAAVSLGLPARGWLLGRVPAEVPLGVMAVWLYVLLSTLPQYYEMRDDGLFLRLGAMRRVLVPYVSLAELQPDTSTKSAGVFSVDRMRVVTTDGRLFLIAPADAEGFVEELARRAPQLERKGFGLAPRLTAWRQ